jgi:hypothetical protein
VFTWDKAGSCYALHWFDSTGGPPALFTGSFDNQVLMLTSRNSQGYMRVAWDFSKEKMYTYTMGVSPDGKQWFPFMNGTYKRADKE